MMSKRKKKGFTLIELIVVIAILGILAAVAIPKLTGFQKSARINADISTAGTIVSSAKSYVADHNLTDTQLAAVNIATLTGANLIDTPSKTQVDSTDFFLEVSGTVDAPVYKVFSGGAATGTMIYPTPAGNWVRP